MILLDREAFQASYQKKHLGLAFVLIANGITVKPFDCFKPTKSRQSASNDVSS